MTRWVDRSIRTKGFTALAVPVLVLVVLLGATFWAGDVNLRAEQSLASAEQLLAATSDLQLSLTSLQVNCAAYLLTDLASDELACSSGHQKALADFIALNAVGPQTAQIATAASRAQRDAISTFARTTQLLDHQRGGSFTMRVAAVQGELRATSILQADIDRLTDLENDVIGSDQAHAGSSRDVVVVVAIVAIVLIVGSALVAWRFFTVGIVRRLEDIGRAADALETGRIRGIPGGDDEIGRLGRRLNHAASQLQLRQHERDRAQALLEDLLTASPVVSLRFDPAAGGRLVYASPNLDHLFGISAEEAQRDRSQILERIHPADLQTLRPLLLPGTMRDGERRELILRMRRDPDATGWDVTAEAVVTLVPDARGGTDGVVAYLVDVTERQQARQAAAARLDLVESIFDASPDTIAVRDRGGRVLLASGAGTVAGDTDGRPVELGGHGGRIAAGEQARLDRLIARCGAGAPTEPLRVRSTDAAGHTSVFEVRARPVVNSAGDITGTVTVSRDVTEQIQLEESLRSASADARQANEAKSEFLSRMSHELRTPLNAILGFAQLLELDERTAQEAANIGHIYRAGEHLLSLINEVLDISRIEAGRLSISEEPVAVAPVMQEVKDLLTPIAIGARVELVSEPGSAAAMHVMADRQRLLQVLTNLGANAIKYNVAGGHAVFRTTPVGTDRVRFSVSDTGPGIPVELQSQLFVPFSRLGAEHSGIEGTGVGLALSKHLVELMGGEIGVESAPGAGSTFWIELYRCAAPAGAEAAGAGPMLGPPTWAPGAGPLGTGGGHPVWSGTTDVDPAEILGREAVHENRAVVVHVEDNASNASFVEQVLSRRPGVRLVTAPTGRLGIEAVRRNRPQLVLLDMHLPDLTGEEVLLRIKADEELADTKVAILSADATTESVRRMRGHGIVEYLTKPIDVDQLLGLVDRETAAREVPT